MDRPQIAQILSILMSAIKDILFESTDMLLQPEAVISVDAQQN